MRKLDDVLGIQGLPNDSFRRARRKDGIIWQFTSATNVYEFIKVTNELACELKVIVRPIRQTSPSTVLYHYNNYDKEYEDIYPFDDINASNAMLEKLVMDHQRKSMINEVGPAFVLMRMLEDPRANDYLAVDYNFEPYKHYKNIARVSVGCPNSAAYWSKIVNADGQKIYTITDLHTRVEWMYHSSKTFLEALNTIRRKNYIEYFNRL
jgi:hypothetical protein